MFKHNIFILLFILLGSSVVNAQTIDQARALFNQKQYEEAKPLFEKFKNSNPNNANYNYWYGVCAYYTNEAEKAIKPLVLANKRRVPNAALYLSKAYVKTYNFEAAQETLETLIKTENRRKKDTSDLETLLDNVKLNIRMLRGVEQVMVIDSVVISKIDFLNAIKISPESGALSYLIPFTKDSLEFRPVVFETERANVRYFSKRNIKGYYQLYQQSLIGDNNWSKSELLTGLSNNDSINVSYPYMLNDGVTLFFASDLPETSSGGYDIKVTRYNSATDSYLIPENIGMPFNSIYNDYLYVIDEYNNLGWFVSDRFQPADKVCVYTFIPNKIKRTYSYEDEPIEKLRNIAQLKDIKLTWTDSVAVQEGLDRLAFIKNYQPKEKQDNTYSFILNDDVTYYSITDFKSEQAKELYLRYKRLESDIKEQKDKLSNLRDRFGAGDKSVTPAILDLEKQVYNLENELIERELFIRKIELNTK